MPRGSRVARLQASAKARKDPFNRAVRAPAKAVTPVPCPLGKCDHLAGMHDLVKAGEDSHGWPIAGAWCTAPECPCEGRIE